MTQPAPTDATVFDPATVEQATQSIVETLVGEGRKFKDVEALAKGKLESDQFIERITNENAAMRKDMEALQLLVKDTLGARGNQPAPSQPTGASVDPSDLSELIRNEITQTRQKEAAQSNLVEADRVLVAHYGTKEQAQKAITEKARELGMPVSWMTESAARNPKALYTLLGLGEPTKQPVTPSSKPTVNTDAANFAPTGAGSKVGTKEYYDAMRRENPSLYWNPRTQQEIHKKALEGVYKTR
jgi:hypothetical protein